LPGNGAGDVVGDARPSAEDALVFVSRGLAQPPSAAAMRPRATTSVRFIMYPLSRRSAIGIASTGYPVAQRDLLFG
jgi:hypothetical protein